MVIFPVYLRSMGMILQYLKASPVYPGMQLHDGEWLITWQLAFVPQVPGQGSIHLFLMQALLEGHSELWTHSGLQFSYGFPTYSGRHMHEPAPFSFLQMAFVPQGEGIHGFKFSGAGRFTRKIIGVFDWSLTFIQHLLIGSVPLSRKA